LIKSYLKTALRNLGKKMSFTAINVAGLSVGLATCLLIFFYIIDEWNYDRYNDKANRIYRINIDVKFGGATSRYAAVQAPMATAIKNDIPQIAKVVRIRQSSLGQTENFRVKKGSENLLESKVLYADPDIFDVFTLPSVSGNLSTALADPRTVVITESIAKKYFNNTNVVGQTLVFNDTINYKVTGVIKDIPRRSHFNADFLLSMSSNAASKTTSWSGGGFNTYILLMAGADPNNVEHQLDGMAKKYIEIKMQGDSYYKYSLAPLTSIHLRSNRLQELGANGNIQYVYMFLAVAIFILLIACVNFMNLSTARSANRAKEVGVRKVLGAPRKHLIAQFLAESITVTFISTLLAILLAWLFLPLFNQIADKELAFTLEMFLLILPFTIVLSVVIGLIAGSYPAFFLSSFNPISVLKGKLAKGFKTGGLRSSLIVLQFSVSIFLIIGTLVIYNQLNYIQNKNLGYNRSQVLVVKNLSAMGSKAKILKQDVQELPGVTSATMTGYLPTEDRRKVTALFPELPIDQKKAILTEFWPVDEDYIKTLELKMVSGRNFSKELLTDSSGIIINETAAHLLGFANPLEKQIYRQVNELENYRIIGVMKDFNFNSLRDNITPVAFVLGENKGALSIRVKTDNIKSLVSQIKAKWTALLPIQQFEYSFMDADFDAMYRSEQRIANIFFSFTGLALAIACLGLFGLSAYAAEQRAREIGIRKLLGASVSIIVGMLAKDFIKLVLIAILVSSPIAWLFMHHWLQDFAYRVNLHWSIFVIAGLAAILIAFITVSFESVKTALINPSKSLRND
jgi:putative ABC transport system permease protein